jgi:AP-2 complex subunit beta-1
MQTFIRGAAGKALTDSPALNAHSRAVLVPLATNGLLSSRTEINVPGPGPIEPQKPSAVPLPEGVAEKPSPPPPPDDDLLDTDVAQSGDAASDGDDEDGEQTAQQIDDPYSNLDGAFGSYLADQPRPMTDRDTEDDLLF